MEGCRISSYKGKHIALCRQNYYPIEAIINDLASYTNSIYYQRELALLLLKNILLHNFKKTDEDKKMRQASYKRQQKAASHLTQGQPVTQSREGCNFPAGSGQQCDKSEQHGTQYLPPSSCSWWGGIIFRPLHQGKGQCTSLHCQGTKHQHHGCYARWQLEWLQWVQVA